MDHDARNGHPIAPLSGADGAARHPVVGLSKRHSPEVGCGAGRRHNPLRGWQTETSEPKEAALRHPWALGLSPAGAERRRGRKNG